jgi:hypothetical protein
VSTIVIVGLDRGFVWVKRNAMSQRGKVDHVMSAESEFHLRDRPVAGDNARKGSYFWILCSMKTASCMYDDEDLGEDI